MTQQLTNKLDTGSVAINVDHHPEWCSGVEARQKDSFVVAVDVEHHITTRSEVKGKQDPLVNVAFRQGLAPKARTAGQI